MDICTPVRATTSRASQYVNVNCSCVTNIVRLRIHRSLSMCHVTNVACITDNLCLTDFTKRANRKEHSRTGNSANITLSGRDEMYVRHCVHNAQMCCRERERSVCMSKIQRLRSCSNVQHPAHAWDSRKTRRPSREYLLFFVFSYREEKLFGRIIFFFFLFPNKTRFK